MTDASVANASKPLRCAEFAPRVRHSAGPGCRKLAIVWLEQGGPELKHPGHVGFGSRLIKAVLDGSGGVRLDLNSTGLASLMLVDQDRPDPQIEERPRTSRMCGSKPHQRNPCRDGDRPTDRWPSSETQ